MRERKERVHGPYKHGQRWRIKLVRADGESSVVSFASKSAALDFAAEARGEVTGITIAGAIDQYIDHCATRGLKSVTTIGYRLRGLLRPQDEPERQVRQLTPGHARDLFERRATQPTRTGRPPSADTQVGELAAVNGFAEWCVEQGWIAENPFVGLEPTGPRARGKKQLRIDEARRFTEVALGEGSDEGLAAAMALLMDLRASEIIERQVRDVDDQGRVLWIDRAKTEAGDRHLEIPLALRDALAARCAGRKPEDLLFPGRSRHWVGYHVRRLCEAAGVPVVCPHGLRGTHSSISVREVSIEHVAAALGHSSPAVTRRHYVMKSAEQAGRQRAMLKIMDGGIKR